MKTIKNKTVVFTLRMSPDLLDTIKTMAAANKRSAAKQMEFMLEKALKEKRF